MTPNSCLDGKKHHWKEISCTESYGAYYYYHWCYKCGSITEFFR